MTDPVRYDREGDVALLTIANPPVNALGHAVRLSLVAAIERFEEDDAKIAVILGDGKLFLGGADISEFGKPPKDPWLPEVVNRVEACTKPVVASIHGAALGGGLEIALGCHYRMAMPGTKLGLPEVTLGILPGAGGTQRTPRLTGLGKAIEMATSGKPLGPEEGLEAGLIDRIGEGDARSAGIAYAQELLESGAERRPVGEMPRPAADPDAVAAAEATLAKTAKGLVAPQHAMKAVVAASEMEITEGLAEERRLFQELIETPQREGLIHAFFLERKVSQLPEIKGVTPREVGRIGVIGGGTMGAGIATAALVAGLDVTLIEQGDEAAEKARGTIEKNLGGAVKRGKMSESQRDAILSDAFRTDTDFAALSRADLAIEAVFESMDVKKEVFGKLDAAMKPGAVLATNTSYLDVNEIAQTTSRPGDVIGLHFFSPAHVMKLLEVVVADETKPDVTATAFALAKKLRKIAVRAGVCDGFIGNRMLSHYRGAADRMILEGASPYQIDLALTEFGFAMGPFAVADLAGLDIGYMTRQRKEPTRDPRDVVPTWADELYHLGRLGQKTGRGYYIYESGARSGEPDPEVEALIAKAREEQGVSPREFTDGEIQRRYMAAMVNEGAKVLGEGIAQRPLDIDAVKLFGYGFPRHRGGPMKWADMAGLSGLLDDIRAWEKDDPYFWTPAPLLEQLVKDDSNFDSLNGWER